MTSQSQQPAGKIAEIYFALNTELKFTYWDESSENLTRISSDEVLGKTLSDIFPRVNNRILKTFDNVLKTKLPKSTIIDYTYKGSITQFQTSIYPASEGIAVFMHPVNVKEKTSIEGDGRYRNILDNMIEGCAIIGFDWKYLYANEVHINQVKYKESPINKDLLNLLPGFKNTKFYEAYCNTMENRISEQLEEYLTFPDGETRWFEARSIPVPEGIFIHSIDVTERKRSEEELQRYQSILTQAEKMAHLGSWWIELSEEDINKNKLSWSEEVYRIFGYEPFSVEVTNDLFFDHVHPDDRDSISEKVRAAISHHQPYDFEHRIIRPDGTERIVHEYATVIYDDNGIAIRIIGAINDITNLKTAIKERDTFLLQIEQERDKLKTVIDSVPDEIWVFDNNGKLLFVNPAVKEGLGFDDIDRLTLNSVVENLEIRHVDGKIRKPGESALYRSLSGEMVVGDEIIKHLKTGEYRYRHFSSSPIKDKSGGISGVIVVVSDITAHKRSEERILELLRISELKTAELNAIIESMPDAVYIGSREGMTLCNKNALNMLGANSLEDLKERIGELAARFNIRWPESGIPLTEDELQFSRALHGETVVEEVLATNAQTGEDIYIRSACAPVIHNGNIIGAVAVNSDITGNKEAEKYVKNSLKEKEVLLRELYHRTKNNMQVISSILGLKASTISDPQTSEILDEMKNRILSIALVHQKLYQSSNLSRVDLKEYITDLINLLKSSYMIYEDNVSIDLELENLSVLIDTAIPCGLIINELVSNSLKYAFDRTKHGLISVKLRRTENDIIELIISDNGKGMSLEYVKEGQKLGLQLVKLIAEDQLQADTEFHFDNGVTWVIRFKDSLYEERI